MTAPDSLNVTRPSDNKLPRTSEISGSPSGTSSKDFRAPSKRAFLAGLLACRDHGVDRWVLGRVFNELSTHGVFQIKLAVIGQLKQVEQDVRRLFADVLLDRKSVV